MNARPHFENVTTKDLYYAVHKGIRLADARMLIALGQADATDDKALMEVLGALSAHLDLSLSHLSHENHRIHAVVEARVPGGATHQDDDHDHHLAAFDELRRMAEEVAMAGADRPAKLRRLYQRFAIFMAEDLTHMHEEETELMPLIATHFSADEIEGIEHSIVSDIPPAKMAGFMRYMLGATSRSERIGMVTGLRQAMPVEVFDGLFASVMGEVWQFGDWDRMEKVLC